MKADESAHRINKLHEVIKGEDIVTGYYDALVMNNSCGSMHVSKYIFYERQ